MRIACVADLHGHLPEIPDCSLLVIAGDITPYVHLLPKEEETTGKLPSAYHDQLKFLNGPFREWLTALMDRSIAVVGIAGNHDLIFDAYPGMVPTLPWAYVQDSAPVWKHAGYMFPYHIIDSMGLKIWGTPWALPYGSWPFMATEEFLARQFSAIPEDTDILIAHGPPYGHGDACPPKITAENEHLWPEPRHEGSHALLERITQIKPKLVVYGHIHEGHGTYKVGETILVNAAVVDRGLELVHPAIVLDLDLGHKVR